MIAEDYISRELAELLQKKGFDERTEYVYTLDGSSCPITIGSWRVKNPVPKPTFQMVMKWLREEKKIFIEINKIDYGYRPIIKSAEDADKDIGLYIQPDIKSNLTYEEAVLFAINYIIQNNLI